MCMAFRKACPYNDIGEVIEANHISNHVKQGSIPMATLFN